MHRLDNSSPNGQGSGNFSLKKFWIPCFAQEGRDCGSRGFVALIVTQFLGALNDNVFKMFVALLLATTLVENSQSTAYLCLTQAGFALPYIVFSSWAGALADSFSKTIILRWMKFLELVVILLGFWMLSLGSPSGLIITVVLLGAQSTLFSPSKYGILPELLDDEHLSKANGFLELWTFIAIISGTALGSFLKVITDDAYLIPGLAVLIISLGGILASFALPITRTPETKVPFQVNPFFDCWQGFQEMRQDRALLIVLLGIGFFWFASSYSYLNILIYLRGVYPPETFDAMTGVFLFSLGCGVGLGSVFAGYTSEGKVELGLIPIGAVGIAIWTFLLGLMPYSLFVATPSVFLLGFSAGIYIVPLNAYLQRYTPLQCRGRCIATSNVIAMGAVVLASLMLWLFMDGFGLSSRTCFTVLGVCSFLVCYISISELPESLVRCVNWFISHFFYRVRVIGKTNIPEEGGALIVCNHVSWVDASLLLASIERPIRFLMYKPLFDMKYIHTVVKSVGAIPIDSEGSPKETIRSLKAAREAIEQGELVCIFAEGVLTRIGRMVDFQKGFEHILKGVDAPIIPAYLDQLWGSIFSFQKGKFFWKWPREIPYQVTLAFGRPMKPMAKVHEVRQAIQELSSDLFKYRDRDYRTLRAGFLRSAKSHLSRPAVSDTTGKDMTYLELLAAVLVLSRRIRRFGQRRDMIGLLLPTSVVGVLSNIATLFAGRIPVNINYTASEESRESAVQQCNIQTILTCRPMVEKLELKVDSRMVFIEDLAAEISSFEKKIYGLCVWLLPSSLLELFFESRFEDHDIATVIFSSGSTGEPKGVMLSHGNISSNLLSLYDVFQMDKNDCMLGVLPFFHSFGFTATLWLPLLAGIRACYHSNPMEAGIIGDLAEEKKATLFLATPTFLLGYLRKVKPEQFKTLRLVVVGAEKLKPRLAQSFQQKFGVIPMEGYGTTELSPVAVMNLPDFKGDVGLQIGNKPGSVGHPIPGVAVRIVDPDSFQTLQPGEPGLLLVKGPNVMLGYLGKEDLTDEVKKDGWYVTGDIATLDEEGFVTITDRLSRFSKIGGEMVPHIKIEEEIHRILDTTEQICVVTAVPDEKKGERLVILSTRDIEPARMVKKLAGNGLPNLWIPKKENFYIIDELPVLGSGKLDLKQIKQLAIKLS